jgi:hypothetical protein
MGQNCGLPERAGNGQGTETERPQAPLPHTIYEASGLGGGIRFMGQNYSPATLRHSPAQYSKSKPEQTATK